MRWVMGLICALWLLGVAPASAATDPPVVSDFNYTDPENSTAGWFRSATSPSGDALLVWADGGEPGDYFDGGPVRARLARADGTLEPVQQISPDEDGSYVSGAHSAINATGAGVVVWTRQEDGSQNAESGRRVLMRGRSPSGALGLVIDTAETGAPQAVGIDAHGTVHMLVMHERLDGDHRYALRRVTVAGIVQQEFELTSGEDGVQWEQLQVSSSGRAVAIGVKRGDRIVARAVDRDGSIGPVTQISPPWPGGSMCGADIDKADLAINENGDAYVAWSLHACSDDRILGRVWKADGSLGETQALAEGIERGGSYADDRDPDASINADGSAYVTWSDEGSVRGRLRHPDGSLSETDLLTTGGSNPKSTFDDRGRATVVWIDRANWTGRLFMQTLIPEAARGELVSTSSGGDMIGVGAGHFAISTGAEGNPLLLRAAWGGAEYNHYWIVGLRLTRWAPPTEGDPPPPPSPPPPQTEPPQTETRTPSHIPVVPSFWVSTPRPSPPHISARLSRRRLVAANAARQRRLQRSVTLAYRLSEQGKVTLALERIKCNGARCQRLPIRRLLRSKSSGRHVTSLDGLARGRVLKPGRYRIAVRLRTTDATSRLAIVPFSVLRPTTR
jgi:hypothetical protein